MWSPWRRAEGLADEMVDAAALHHAFSLEAPSVIRRSAMNSSSTAAADRPSAQFLASPRSLSAAGPADATCVRIPAAQAKELAMLIGVKTTGETPASAHATG